MNGIPDVAAVVGGGRMGAGIAQVLAMKGAQVTISDPTGEKSVLDRVNRGLQNSESRGGLAESIPVILGRVAVVGDVSAIPADTGMVIEAVPEIPELKSEILRGLEAVISSTAIIASNTSSLSITDLSEHLEVKDRFIGSHFFNPVPASALVEIVRGRETSEATIAGLSDLAGALGKTPVVINDSPGFTTSRLGVLLGLEAIRMLEEGIADAEAIDQAMELGYRHPMGPLRSTDLVGLDVRLAVAEYLQSTLGDHFAPPQLLREKVERGELGKKTGHGFYRW